LLKWIGNKFRHAEIIAAHLPSQLGTYYEPFAGTAALAATLTPTAAVASDALPELVALFELVKTGPEDLLEHYQIWSEAIVERGNDAYLDVRNRFNTDRRPEDLLVLSRTCWGGVVRFTRSGTISTPLGPHRAMSSAKLAGYLVDWRARLRNVDFRCQDFAATMGLAGVGDTIYCDPPFSHGQAMLYGAHDFRLESLWEATAEAADRGARVAVSLDGSRKSGKDPITPDVPPYLFVREVLIDSGGCMLRRFRAGGQDMRLEQVSERLLLTW